jgi:hypothetical protein
MVDSSAWKKQPMAIKLFQNTSTCNMRMIIHNHFKIVLSKKRWHFLTNYDSIVFHVAMDNNIFEL